MIKSMQELCAALPGCFAKNLWSGSTYADTLKGKDIFRHEMHQVTC